MNPIRRADVATFNRRCSAFGLIFLVVTVGVRTLILGSDLPAESVDYPQYYMAGLIARSGQWQALYPIPIPGSAENPGSDRASNLRPEYAQLAAHAGVDLHANRFMQPPPIALLLYPLALFSFRVAYHVWIGLLLLATWGMSRQASRLYSICRGNIDERMAGLVAIAVCVSPQAHRWIRVGNMSALIGWCLGFSILHLLRRKAGRGGVAIAIAGIAKYVSFAWFPLLVITRQWRTLAWAIGFIAAAVVLSLGVMGSSPFHIFVNEIAPTLNRCTLLLANDSLCAFFMRMAGVNDERLLPSGWHALFVAMQFGSLAFIFLSLVLRRKKIEREATKFTAAAITLLGWTLIFSPILWEHYQAYLAVFWGWLLAEARRSTPRLAAAILVLLLIAVPTRTPALDGKIPEPIASHLLWGTVLFVGLAIAAVWRNNKIESSSTMTI